MATSLSPEQERLAQQLVTIGRQVGASPKEIKAALETASVEKNFTNTGGGDADSSNWRQERASVYGGQWAKTGGALNLGASARRFFTEARQANRTGQYGSAGALAAAVQRPAAQYRGRYQDVSGQAESLLRSFAADGGGTTNSPAAAPSSSGAAAPAASAIGDLGSSPNGAQVLAGLLSGQGQQRPASSGGGLQAPSFAARPAMASSGPVSSGGGPAPRGDIGALISAAQTPGQAAASQLASASPLVADASTAAAASGGTSGASAGSGGAQAALGWAQSKVGFKETGENAGGLAGYLNQRFGFSNAPWCAMFTSAAVTKGGAPAVARTASVEEVRRQATSGGLGYQKGFVDPQAAKAGDLILFGNDHIAMVQRVAKGKVFYVGGNQSNGVTESSVPVGRGDIVRPKYGAR